MGISKADRKRIAAQEGLRRAANEIDDCYLASTNLDQVSFKIPPADPFGHPEFANFSLTIQSGESMMIADRLLLRGQMALEPSSCVIMDEFGGDFACEVFSHEDTVLLIPIGHHRQELWPSVRGMQPCGSTATDGGSLAFLSSADVPEPLADFFYSWRCKPGEYNFFYEEIVQLGALKQPSARNIIVGRSNS